MRKRIVSKSIHIKVIVIGDIIRIMYKEEEVILDIENNIEMIKEEVDEDHIQMKEERVTKKEKGAKVILTATIQNLIQDQNQKEKSNQTQVSIDIITSKKKQIK